MPVVLRSLLAAAVSTGIVVGAGLLLAAPDEGADPAGTASGDGSSPSGTPTPAPVLATPLREYDTSTVAVQRRPFCDLVAPEAVSGALGTDVGDVRAYGNGESATITQQVKDIAHEFGCVWAVDGRAARAWVFAPPVTVGQGRALTTSVTQEKGCTALPQAPAFGKPSVGLVCTTKQGLQASYRGLFGDAWLSCSLSGDGDRAALVERVGEFCVAVAQAAATP